MGMPCVHVMSSNSTQWGSTTSQEVPRILAVTFALLWCCAYCDGAFRIYAQDELSKVISLKKGQSKVWPSGI
jgi:hypothetical protein